MELKKYLDIEGIKRQSFAERVGISVKTLYLIENGETSPNISICLKIEEETEGLVRCQELAPKVKRVKKK